MEYNFYDTYFLYYFLLFFAIFCGFLIIFVQILCKYEEGEHLFLP